jgi:hypothetical protein
MLNVKEFGAVGDGVTDDTAAFQAVLDTKQLVFVPYTPSAYVVSDLTIPLGSAGIRGEAMGTRISAIKHKAGSSGSLIHWDGSGRVTNAHIEDLYLEGNSEAGETHGLDLSGFSYCSLSRLYVRLFTLDGCYADGAITPIVQQFSNNTFTQCRFNNNFRDGLRLDNSSAASNANTANTFVGCGYSQNAETGIKVINGSVNYWLGCTSQGNGTQEIHFDDVHSTVFEGYMEGTSKGVELTSSSSRNRLTFRSSFPIWNTLIDNGEENTVNLSGSGTGHRNLFPTPYWQRWVDALPAGVAVFNTPIVSSYLDSGSPFGSGLQVVIDGNWEGLIFSLTESPEELAGKWITLVAVVETSGVTDTLFQRIHCRMDGVTNPNNGEFVAQDLPITAAGEFKVLSYDMRFEDVVAPSTADLLWFISSTGAITTNNTVKIRSVHVVTGRTRGLPDFAGEQPPSESVAATTLADKTMGINIHRKTAGRLVHDSTAGVMRFATGSSSTSSWSATDGSGDITPA